MLWHYTPMRIVSLLEIILGIVFTISAASKALDWYTFAFQVSAYGIVREPALVSAIALTMIGVETLLAVLLLSGFRLRGATLAATAALLIVFSGLIAYGWIFHNLKDCGCFGAYLKMGPGPSLAKNAVLLALTVVAAVLYRRKSSGEPAAARIRLGWLLGVVGLIVIGLSAALGKPAPAPPVAGPAGDDPDRPFAAYSFDYEGRSYDLGSGDYLVAMLSATCEHCQAAVGVLNKLATEPGTPSIVALMLGTEQEMEEFRDLTSPEFPIYAIDGLQFMNLIAKEPPRFYIIRGGREARHIDVLDPTLEDLEKLVKGNTG